MHTIALETMDGRLVAGEVRLADPCATRTASLSGDDVPNAGQGLLLVPGRSIHTFAMRSAIDVVFLDRHMRVLELAPNVAPRRVRFSPPLTTTALELSSGRIAAVGLSVGTQLVIAKRTPAARVVAPCASASPNERAQGGCAP